MRKIAQNFLLAYLRFFAKIQLAKIQPEVISITGSAGKTSTVQAVKTILSSKFKTKFSEKANSETGIPLDILGLKPHDYSIIDWLRLLTLCPLMILLNWKRYEKYVVEMGVDSPYEPKNMTYLLKIIKPRVGVFLNALPVHTQFFDREEKETDPKRRENLLRRQIANEKGKLIQSLPSNGYAILNVDDPFVSPFTKKTLAKCLTLGHSAGDFIILNTQKDLTGFACHFSHKEKKYTIAIQNQILSDDYAYTFLAAIAVGLVEGIPIAKSILALENNFQLPPGRMSLIPGIKGTILIDSSYNASKFTMLDALKTLQGIAGRVHIAVLGDMRELGKETKLAHEEVAKVAIESAETIITVGPLMKQYLVPKILHLGFSKDRIFSFVSSKGVGEWLEKNIVKGKEIILVKGSQNTIFLERVVEELMANRREADKLLCRRGKFWDQKRQEV